MRITTDRRKTLELLRKLAWFAGLWLAGVLTVGSVAAVLRFLLRTH